MGAIINQTTAGSINILHSLPLYESVLWPFDFEMLFLPESGLSPGTCWSHGMSAKLRQGLDTEAG